MDITPMVEEGKPAPPFTLPSASGEEVMRKVKPADHADDVPAALDEA